MTAQRIARLLQPHEGIGGTPRSPGDPLVSSQQASEIVAELTVKLYRLSLVGNPAPIVAEAFARMTSPRPGDRVVVRDSVDRREPLTRFQGVGYLVAVREEWAETDEEWERARAEDGLLSDDERFIEHAAWYVQYGPDPVDICRWVNCTILALP